jgi:repressor LexA
MPITPKQQRIYEFIRGSLQANGEPPTIAEIQRQFRIRSTATVHAILAILQHEGLITRTPHIARGIVLAGEPEKAGIVLQETSELVM